MILLGVVAITVVVGAVIGICLVRELRAADRRQAEWIRRQAVESLSSPILDESVREWATAEEVGQRQTA